METIFVVLILFMVGLVSLMFLSQYYMRFWLNLLIGKKHEWLDYIIATSYVPPEWSKRYNKRLRSSRSAGNGKLEKVKKKALEDYLQRLDKLDRYVKVSTLVANEAERSQIRRSLKNIARQWREDDGIYETFDFERR